MKQEKRIVGLDPYEEGAVINALNDMRNKGIAQKQSTDFVDDLIIKILHAPTKRMKVRDEAR